jgi:hypothetical protein
MVSGAPAWVSWAALLLGVAALGIGVVTLPTAFQMFWGHPKLRISFADARLSKINILRCYIANVGIENRWLRRLGVVRSPTNVSADFEIYEFGTNRQIVSTRRATLHAPSQSGDQVEAAFSVTPIFFNLIFHGENGQATVKASIDGDDVVISPGKYYAKITVITSHQDIMTRTYEFVVGSIRERTFWTSLND